MQAPKFPIMFPKFPTSITGHGDDIEIPKIAQDDQADYEAELLVVIGKDAKDVQVADAWDFVLGYAASNDVSARLARSLLTNPFFPIRTDPKCTENGKWIHHLWEPILPLR